MLLVTREGDRVISQEAIGYERIAKDKQETEGNCDCLMPFLQGLVQHENEWVESPLRIRFGNED